MNEHPINAMCQERYIDVRNKIDIHDEKINELETTSAKYFEKVDNLCKNIEGLTATLQWGIGLIVPALIAVVIKSFLS